MADDDIAEAGAFMVKKLNGFELEKRRAELIQTIGALVELTDIQDKSGVLREVMAHLNNHEQPKYFG